MSNDLDIPFEEGPLQPVSEPLAYSGGVVVMASVVDLDGPVPALIFRFATPVGDFYTPICLVLDEGQMEKLPTLITQAIAAARKGAARL